MSNNVKILLIALYKLTFAQDQVPVTNGYGTANALTTLKTINSIPSGAIVFFDSGSCPSGFTEVSGLDGKYILGTVSANSNVGTTGGSNSYTPVGTNSSVTITPLGTISTPIFTGNAVVAASTNSGTKLVTANTSSGVSPVTTATGTISTPTFTGSSTTVGAETFTGNAATIQPSYIRLIGCKVN